MLWTTKVLVLLNELIAVGRSILKALRLRRPGLVFLVVTGEFTKGHTQMLRFKLILPAPGASDVVTRKLSIQVGNGDPQNFALPGDALETQEFEGEDNAAVSGQLVDVDDAGNESEPRDYFFLLVDTLAPPQPGEIGLVVTGEE